MNDEKIINIYSCDNLAEANRMVLALKESGIESYTRNISTQNLLGLGCQETKRNPEVGSYNIEIRESDYAQAIELLEELRQSEY